MTPERGDDSGQTILRLPRGRRRRRGPAAEEWRPAFLAVLRETCNVRVACRAAGITRRAAYGALAHSQEFRLQWADAMLDGGDALRAVAWVRAQQSSDQLLMFLLRAHCPEYGGSLVPPSARDATQPEEHEEPDANRMAAILSIFVEAGLLPAPQAEIPTDGQPAGEVRTA